MRRLFFMLFLGALFFICTAGASPAGSRQEHIVYYQGTPHELNVYKIYGRKDGPTMMLVGGIQGDEPGGFLSADTYIDLALRRGNLIVVPRANFNSILQFKRGPNGDMNRKFGGREQGDHESRIVRILEELMGESDILLNLHDGWGFYRPTFENKMKNPMRYGQSIIADAEEYVHPITGQKLYLKKIAQKALSEINAQIDDPQYHFNFMNTRTAAPNSRYAEQRKSATYYALTKHGIPAFGVETSKNLPTIEMKVHQHNLAVNAFMEIFGLEPEHPRIYLEEPQLNYLIVAVNNQMPVAVAEGQTLYVNPGDTIEVIHVEANYERGLSVDIEGVGTINDYRQRFPVHKPTAIVAQKDHIKFGRVPVALSPAGPSGPGRTTLVARVANKTPAKPAENSPSLNPQTSSVAPKPEADARPRPKPQSKPKPEPKVFTVNHFIIEVDGHRQKVQPGEQLEALDGAKLKIIDIDAAGPKPRGGYVVNFKGFVSNHAHNDGEDRGHVIDTATELLKRYSLSRKEKVYAIQVERGKKVLAKMTVRLRKPTLDYLVVSRNNGDITRLNNGDDFTISPGDQIRVVDVKTNIEGNQGVKVQVQGKVTPKSDPGAILSFVADQDESLRVLVTKDGKPLGNIVLKTG